MGTSKNSTRQGKEVVMDMEGKVQATCERIEMDEIDRLFHDDDTIARVRKQIRRFVKLLESHLGTKECPPEAPMVFEVGSLHPLTRTLTRMRAKVFFDRQEIKRLVIVLAYGGEADEKLQLHADREVPLEWILPVVMALQDVKTQCELQSISLQRTFALLHEFGQFCGSLPVIPQKKKKSWWAQFFSVEFWD